MQLFNRGVQTQNQGPFAREPLYKLAEVAEILDTTSQKLGVLIARHKIEPAIKSRGIGRWRVSDFKKAFNAEFGVEKFKVEKAVPITPIQTSQTQMVVNKLVSLITAMDVGDRVSIEEENSSALLIRLRASMPTIKLVTRKDPADPTTRWVWRAS